ncbi:outer membrane beta-barrel protein [Helicobacter sp. 11S03491-1]|uniref:outer membrane beta-barrel protein n=1 Tax=Helicobacter sp. 11S03491-1 TaxID=1476196 RepID=UPI000BA5C3E3|nr:outer membrane beta-barrel protein [Helicobacter sp. 11S03491-1]PAF41470.1 hypothetical protein BKH45_07055 [Helicobacter sp. 11S03491-1]
MKKIIFLFLLLINYTLASDEKQILDKNQIFIGASIGGAKISKFNKGEIDKPNSYIAFVWGVRGGYQFMPSSYIGLRTYLDYMMSIKPSGLKTIISSSLNLNLDLLVDILHIKENTFGFYGGIGFGYFQHANVIRTTPEDKAFVLGYTGVLNFGLGAKIQNNSRIEIGTKIPFSQIKSIANPNITYGDIYVLASYSYLF